MIDNYDLILPHLNFSDPSKFYFLQIIQRKKENDDCPANNKIVRNFYFHTQEYLEGKYPLIKDMCNYFNARACLRLNRRSYETVAIKTLIKLAQGVEQKNFEHSKKQYDRACGSCHSEKEKNWIVDVDIGDDDVSVDMLLRSQYLEDLKEFICRCHPIDVINKIKFTVPTKNGCHLITAPFNMQQFRGNEMYKKIDILKDNPTNLYIP